MKRILMIFMCAIMVFGITGCGSKKDGESKTKKVLDTFATDDWKTIVENVKAGKTYKVGDTKEIDMGSLGKHTIRVANNSTPDECKKDGYSQTACGFVLEFADIITEHNMNSTSTNVGGWKDSEMRKYVNSDILSALPTELKNTIIDTTVVSGHGSYDSENFTTTDKLYLLSSVEVWGYPYDDTVTTDSTRQLDYYKDLSVTKDNYSGAIKKFDNSESYWWLRSADSYSANSFNSVYNDGGRSIDGAYTTHEVAPAFRIG